MFAIERSQILSLTIGKNEVDSRWKTCLINLAIMIGPVVTAIFYPQVGSIAAVTGAIGGLCCIYLMPTITYMTQSYKAIEHPEMVEAMRKGDMLNKTHE
jgi:hypothetical protein